MVISQKLVTRLVVAAYIVQGVFVAQIVRKNFKSIDQINYLVDMLYRNDISLEEFDVIALQDLGLLVE